LPKLEIEILYDGSPGEQQAFLNGPDPDSIDELEEKKMNSKGK